jgi:hypothetical protein
VPETDPDDAVNDALLGFCVVANVAAETAHGDGGLDIRSGVQHFSAGSKVWVLPPQWGDGCEQVMVVGHHRGTRGRRYARIVMPRRHLTNFRVQAIYKPALFQALVAPQDRYPEVPRLWVRRDDAEQFAMTWREPKIAASLPDFPFSIEATDPPPISLTSGGRIYYLAHFNANRAVYSADPPPKDS